jgi:hypothetical protein
MRLLADENFPKPIVDALRASDQRLPGGRPDGFPLLPLRNCPLGDRDDAERDSLFTALCPTPDRKWIKKFSPEMACLAVSS